MIARSTKNNLVFACVLAVVLPAWVGGVRADQYQEQIARAFPGFEILNRADFTADARAVAKTNPALATGHFNRDEYDDFAAIIINRSKAHGQPGGKKHYLGKYVVCHGTGKGVYECQILKEERMHLPYEAFLFRKKPGKVRCIVNQRDLIMKEVTIVGDAFGWAVPDRGSDTYIYLPDGTYWDCGRPFD